MAFCERHEIYLQDGTQCGKCWSIEATKKKATLKAELAAQKKVNSRKPSERQKLIAKLQKLVSARMKNIFCQTLYTDCWTCGAFVKSKGNSLHTTIHCGHYYPKSIYWELMDVVENSAPQCYSCNINNQGVIPAMRNKLVLHYGEAKIKELDDRAQRFLNDVKLGIKKKRPDEFTLLAMIKNFKK